MSSSYIEELDRAWKGLPELPEVRARWIGPLVESEFAMAISDMSQAAYGHLEDCGWQRELDGLPETFVEDGEVRAEWVEALNRMARALASAGCSAGPDGDEVRWRSWLVFELAKPHAWAREQLP